MRIHSWLSRYFLTKWSLAPALLQLRPVSPTAELLELVEHAAAALPLPAVAQALFPPDRKGSGKTGEFCALRLADGSVGTAFVLLGDTLARLQQRAPDEFVGKPAPEVARLFAGDDSVERALGLAAINAVTQHVFRRAGYEPDLAADSLGSLQPEPGDRVGMIGFFPPLVERVRAQGLPLTVVELRAELVKEEPGLSVTLDPKRLASCNKIVCTSTVLLNDTLERNPLQLPPRRRTRAHRPLGELLPRPAVRARRHHHGRLLGARAGRLHAPRRGARALGRRGKEEQRAAVGLSRHADASAQGRLIATIQPRSRSQYSPTSGWPKPRWRALRTSLKPVLA